MRQRLIGAAVLVPVVVILFVAGPPWLTLGIALLAAAAAYEIALLIKSAGLPANRWLVVAAPLLVAAAVAYGYGPNAAIVSAGFFVPAAGAWVILTAIDAFRRPDPRDGFLGWAGTLLGSLYASLLIFATVIVALGGSTSNVPLQLPLGLDLGRYLLLILVVTVWALDSFAFLAGKYHGRGRFMNHISPNKTWSGAIGGAVAAVVVSTALFAVGNMDPLAGVIVGAVIAVTAQAGDIAESMLKRAAGAKDSGTLIPGHGGFLDRVDSFLFAAPAMYATLIVILHFNPFTIL